ncbi:MAG: hypothetical protein ABI425_02435 [Patescibacteria group bacterium]
MVDFSPVFSSNNESVIFSCGLLLAANQEASAIALCDQIAKNNPNKLKFILNKVTHPPYVRLYETVLPSKNIPLALDRLEKISADMIPFQMDWGMIEQTNHFVAIWGELNDTLKVFHQAVLIDINNLREGDFKEKYIEDENNHAFSEKEDESFRKWGSPWVDPYIPHMVVAKAEPVFDVKKTTLEWKFKHCLFRGLLIGIRSEHGDFTHSYQINFKQPTQTEIDIPELSVSSVLSLK